MTADECRSCTYIGGVSSPQQNPVAQVANTLFRPSLFPLPFGNDSLAVNTRLLLELEDKKDNKVRVQGISGRKTVSSLLWQNTGTGNVPNLKVNPNYFICLVLLKLFDVVLDRR